MPLNDQTRWNNRYKERIQQTLNFSSTPFRQRKTLLEAIPYFKPGGTILDIAMGMGHESGYLASLGFNVLGIDISSVAVRYAKYKYPAINCIIADLSELPFVNIQCDAIINFYYLQRELSSFYLSALKPGGILVIETLTTQMKEIKPEIQNEYLLKENEILNFAENCDIIFHFEGWADTETGKKAIAALIAQKPVE